MIESEQALLADILSELKAIKKTQIKRDDLRQMVMLSDGGPYMLDYRDRYYVYCWSAVALTLTAEDIGLITVPANSWVNLNFPPGLRIYTAGQGTTLTPLYILQTDSSLSSASASGGGGGGGGGGVVTQGTIPWLTQVTNVNANGQETMALSSPVVLPSDQIVPVSGATGSIVDLLALLNGLAIPQGTALGTTPGPLIQGSVSAAAPAYTSGQISPLSLTANGTLRTQQNIGANAVTGGVGTVTNATPRIIQSTDATGTQTSVASSATSTTILASNTGRVQAIIFNDSTQILYLLFVTGGTASATTYSVQVPAQGYFELPGPTVFNGAIIGIWAAANGNARVTEFS